jgi:hypothetical protein
MAKDVLEVGIMFNSKEVIYKLQVYPVVYPPTFHKSTTYVLKKRIHTINLVCEIIYTI